MTAPPPPPPSLSFSQAVSWRRVFSEVSRISPQVAWSQLAVAYVISVLLGVLCFASGLPLIIGGEVALFLPAGLFAALAVHEYAHAAAAVRAGGSVRLIRLSVFYGLTFVDCPDDAPLGLRVWVPLSGAVASLLASLPAIPLALVLLPENLAVGGPFAYWAAANFLIAAVNLLPVEGLDGYGALATLVRHLMPARLASRLLLVVSALVMSGVVFWAGRRQHWSAWVVAAAFALTAVLPHVLRRRLGADRH